MTLANTNLRPARILVLAGAVSLAAAAILTSVGGCDTSKASASSNTVYVDTDFGFRATPPAGWNTLPAAIIQVPGKVLNAWTPDGATSIVAFTQQAGRPVSAKELLASSAAAMRQAGFKVPLEEVTTIAGKEAMSLQASGPGSGAAIGAGLGSVETYQHWIAIPKQNQVLVLLLTCPDGAKANPTAQFETMLQSLQVD